MIFVGRCAARPTNAMSGDCAELTPSRALITEQNLVRRPAFARIIRFCRAGDNSTLGQSVLSALFNFDG